MRAKLGAPAYSLLDAEPGCCALCKSKLPTEGILYTPDFVFFVRHGQLAHFTLLESKVMYALFKTPGFRLSRGNLIGQMYSGCDEPLTSENVLAVVLTSLRPKLLPLGMGIISNSGIINLVFTPPGYKRVA